jgi:hypothetical protein
LLARGALVGGADDGGGAAGVAVAVFAAALDAPAVALRRRRVVAAAGFSTRARFSRSQRARTRATCSSLRTLKWLRTGTYICRSRLTTSSPVIPNSLAMSFTRSLLNPSS